MPSGLLRQMRPAWIATFEYRPLEPGLAAGPRKSIAFSVTKVQSPSTMNVARLQSFHPLFFSHTTCEDAPCPRLCASFASSGLKHSSIKSFIPPSGGGARGGPRRFWRPSATQDFALDDREEG